jgi:hypothetical protein
MKLLRVKSGHSTTENVSMELICRPLASSLEKQAMLTSASTPITPHPIPPLVFTIPRYIFLICKGSSPAGKALDGLPTPDSLRLSAANSGPPGLFGFLPLSLLAGDFLV